MGGWIAASGSGQQSTYYGDMCDIVISQEYVTPVGEFKTLDYPGTATGPKVNDIMKGSEGTFGVMVGATLKIFRYMPENRQRFALEVLARVKAAVDGLPVGYRFLADEWLPDGLHVEESCQFAHRLTRAGIAYISVMGGTYESFSLPDIVEKSKQQQDRRLKTATL